MQDNDVAQIDINTILGLAHHTRSDTVKYPRCNMITFGELLGLTSYTYIEYPFTRYDQERITVLGFLGLPLPDVQYATR